MINDRIWTLVSRKLSGEATASELSEMDDLIKSQAYSDLYIQAINEYWSSLPEKDEEFLEATYHLHVNRLKEKGFDMETDKNKEDHEALFGQDVSSRHRSWRKNVGVLSAILFMFTVLFFIRYTILPSPTQGENKKMGQSEVSTKSGSRTQIQLPDGSTVWLNGNSKLLYDNKTFGDKNRQVTLSGEAYFDITKNPAKPFIIHTNKMEIRVIGTAFNVKAYPGDKHSETSLIRGSIEVTLKDRREKIMMKPNEKLIVNDDYTPQERKTQTGKKSSAVAKDPFVSLRHLTFGPDNTTIMETAWVDNKLVFDNESFKEVALKMERWYGVVINFNDENLKTLHITGTFEKETVTSALDALKILSPFNYTIKNDSITIAK